MAKQDKSMKSTNLFITAISAAAILGITSAAHANSAADFYKGKTLTIYVGV